MAVLTHRPRGTADTRTPFSSLRREVRVRLVHQLNMDFCGYTRRAVDQWVPLVLLPQISELTRPVNLRN